MYNEETIYAIVGVYFKTFVIYLIFNKLNDIIFEEMNVSTKWCNCFIGA